MVDEEGGGVQRLAGSVASLPWARDMAATMSTAEVRALAQEVGRQMKSLGVNVDLAPVLDLDGGPTLDQRDPDGPRSFSTDPAIAASYGLAFASGLDAGGVLPVVKHFPGLGGATANTDYGPASTPSITALDAAGLVPFERAVSAGIKAVMVSNATVPGLSAQPASVSGQVVTGLLRNRLHFGGLVMTDSLSAGAITAAGLDLDQAAVAAVKAGVDMILFGSTLTPADTAQLAPAPLAAQTQSVIGAIAQAVDTKALPESRLDGAVLDVVRAKGISLCGPARG
jgi:beta-N-acetylhexosaminidase